MGYNNEYLANARGNDSSGNHSFSLYLREINQSPLLTRTEERAMGRRIRNGDNRALDCLVRANLRFVVSIAKQYPNGGLSLEDLIGEGNLGLVNAARRFDEQRGYKFISYAVWWIRQAILKALFEHRRNCPTDPDAREESPGCDALRDDMARVISMLSLRENLVLELYFGLSGEEPMTLAEIGKKFNLTADRVSQIKNKAIRKLRET